MYFSAVAVGLSFDINFSILTYVKNSKYQKFDTFKLT